MKIREFAREVASLMHAIHATFVRQQPDALMKGRLILSHVVIIDMLRKENECKMSDISEKIGITRSAVTGLVDRLIREGVLRRLRSRKDRRIVRIKLTQRGMKLSNKLNDFRMHIIMTLFKNVSSRERLQYLCILRKLHKNIAVE